MVAWKWFKNNKKFKNVASSDEKSMLKEKKEENKNF